MEDIRDAIQDFVFEHFDFLPAEALIAILAFIPVMELKGAIPAGVLLELSIWSSVFFGIFGNLLPILPMLLLFRPVSTWLKRFKLYKKMYSSMYDKTVSKGKKVRKYGGYGLFLFTAVPLPTTGIYSACFAAIIFFIPVRAAFFAIAAGVIAAGIIVGIISWPLFHLDEDSFSSDQLLL